MVAPAYAEELLYPLIEAGLLTINERGEVWRLGIMRGNRWNSAHLVTWLTHPRRAENSTGPDDYLQVRVMSRGVRHHVAAHRLVWRHFHGSIPVGLTINHRNGIKTDNRPANLELATFSEQQIHARTVLFRGRLDQFGTANAMAKLTTDQVQEIRRRRALGEKLTSIAVDYPVRMQQISKIYRGDRRSLG